MAVLSQQKASIAAMVSQVIDLQEEAEVQIATDRCLVTS
jgi:hypothetical protein